MAVDAETRRAVVLTAPRSDCCGSCPGPDFRGIGHAEHANPCLSRFSNYRSALNHPRRTGLRGQIKAFDRTDGTLMALSKNWRLFERGLR